MNEIILGVPAENQYASRTGEGPRMCCSCSNSMALRFLRPGVLVDGDQLPQDVYLRKLEALGGDTANPQSHIPTLAHYGVKADFIETGSWAKLDAQLERGIPVPIGILIHGLEKNGHLVGSPGGGHYICVIGRTADGTGYIVHDPAGELDLVAGHYVGDSGERLTYHKEHLGPRWMVDGTGGWMFELHK